MRQRGFTLIELITVMVLLSIIAAFSTQFIVTSLDSYNTNKKNNDLLNKGRTSLEQVARYLRSAVPNSARASASGNCLELMPSVGGAFYEGQVADTNNGSSSTSSIATSPFFLGLGTAEYAVIAALDSSEIYTSGSPSSVASLATTIGNPVTSLSLDTPHRFFRNSAQQRVFVGASPIRFCVLGGNLFLFENYGFVTSAMIDGNPGGDSVLMAANVAAVGNAFIVSTGTEDRSASVDISLQFFEENTQVNLQQTVFIRNVP